MDSEKNSREEKAVVLAKKVTEPCPDCGAQLVHQEGIVECLSCGYQRPWC